MKNSGKRKELPVTAILAGLVCVLLVGLAVVLWLNVRQERADGRGQNQKKEQEVQSGRMTEEPPVTDSGEEAESETGSDGKETERGIGSDKAETGAEREAVSDRDESETMSEKNATGKEPLDEGDIDVQTAEEEAEKASGFAAEEESESVSEAELEADSEAGTRTGCEEGAESASEAGPEAGTEEASESVSEPESESETEEKLVVAIDPGHQGSWVNMSDQEPNGPGSTEMKAKASTGTQSPYSGKPEYELNLEVSLLLQEELEKRGYEVILTRKDHDTAISNAERALMAYEQGGDIYVRIHANGSDDTSVSGALAMVPSASNPYVADLAEDSYLLAQCILDAYCERASFSSLGIQYYDNMTGINWSKLPVMILEMGFMTNQNDDARMADPAVQAQMAAGIADGIDAYFEKTGQKGTKTAQGSEQKAQEVSPEAEGRMHALLEKLGEDYLFPAMEQGEQWSVSIADLDTGASGDINGDEQMASASVIKVFIMAAIYDRVCYPASEERHIYFEEQYDGELKQLITDMITVSDNNAANTLLTRLGSGDVKAGMAVVNQFCEENGYTATAVGRKFLEENPDGDNDTSANDCRNLLASIYNGTCVCEEASAKMYAYLKNQTRTWKLPAGLSGTGAVTANKTGELGGEYGQYVENDIAIVEDGGKAYVVCVLSGSLADNQAAMEKITRISKLVYEEHKAWLQ